MKSAPPAVPLQSRDHLARVLRHQTGRLRVALVGAAPARIACHGDRRRKCPVDADGGDLGRGGLADAAHEFGIASGAEAHIVREYRGADDLGVAMHCIDAKDDGDGAMAVGTVSAAMP